MKKYKKISLTKSEVKSRGWTDKLVEQFLPEPDEIKVNPIYKCASPMKLYNISRVKRIERTKKFQTALEESRGRRSGAKKAVATKLDKTRAYLDSLNIEVPKLSWAKLRKNACDSYNDHRWSFADFEPANRDSDEHFLHRIMVNYLRHEMSSYEMNLGEVFGKVGVSEAYLEINRKIYDAIASQYGSLEEECKRQYNWKLDRFEETKQYRESKS